MKTIFCAVCLVVFGSGCAYFKWQESDRPWSESKSREESKSLWFKDSDQADLPGNRAYK